MESLENKIERLSLEQRQELEDFVDFLLQRTDISVQTPLKPASPPITLPVAPPPLSVDESGSSKEKIKNYDLIHQQKVDSSSTTRQDKDSLVQEILDNGDDFLAEEYMDYGQFDKETKITTHKKQIKKKPAIVEKASDVLEWID